MTSLPASRPTHPPSTEADDKRLNAGAFRAWDLTPDARPVLRFFTLIPDQLPSQAGTHDDAPILVDRSFDRPNPFAVLHPSGVDAVFQVLGHPPTLGDLFVTDRPTLDKRPNPQTGGCPWLLTSNLYHLPVACYDSSDPAASESLPLHFTRPSVGKPRPRTLGGFANYYFPVWPRYPSHGRRASRPISPYLLS